LEKEFLSENWKGWNQPQRGLSIHTEGIIKVDFKEMECGVDWIMWVQVTGFLWAGKWTFRFLDQLGHYQFLKWDYSSMQFSNFPLSLI
jgi:hypothetical protein